MNEELVADLVYERFHPLQRWLPPTSDPVHVIYRRRRILLDSLDSTTGPYDHSATEPERSRP